MARLPPTAALLLALGLAAPAVAQEDDPKAPPAVPAPPAPAAPPAKADLPAKAPPPAPAAPPATPPAIDRPLLPKDAAAPPSRVAFRIDAKLPVLPLGALGADALGTTYSFAYATGVPQLLVGVQLDRFGLLLGLGFERMVSELNGPGGLDGPIYYFRQSLTILTVAPTFTADLARSRDRRVALYALVAIPIGLTLSSVDASTNIVLSASQKSGTHTSWGIQAALGARFAVFRGFHLGLEAGPIAQLLLVDLPSSPTITTVYGALTASYLY